MRQHDRVLCRVGAPRVGVLDAVLAAPGGMFAAGVLMAFLQLGLSPVAAAALMMASVVATSWVIGRRRMPWRLEINERWIDVERDRRRWRLPLDDIQRAEVAEPREDYGDPALILASGQTLLRIGEGRPRAELDWIVAAVVEAREAARRREAVDGRLYGFQKKPPTAIDALVRRP